MSQPIDQPLKETEGEEREVAKKGDEEMHRVRKDSTNSNRMTSSR